MITRGLLPVLFSTLCCVLFFTVGCNKGQETMAEAQTLKEAVEKLEAEGKYPKLDRSDSIPGPDVDKNGIRDDIDAYIDSIDNITKGEKGALRQTAYFLNYLLQPDFDLNNPNHIAKSHVMMDQAIDCGYSMFGEKQLHDYLYSDYMDILEAFTYNTKKRFQAYMDYNKALSGTTWRMADGGCDEKFIK